MLRFFAELSLAEIAAETDRPIGTVKTHLFRGLARLRTGRARTPTGPPDDPAVPSERAVRRRRRRADVSAELGEAARDGARDRDPARSRLTSTRRPGFADRVMGAIADGAAAAAGGRRGTGAPARPDRDAGRARSPTAGGSRSAAAARWPSGPRPPRSSSSRSSPPARSAGSPLVGAVDVLVPEPEPIAAGPPTASAAPADPEPDRPRPTETPQPTDTTEPTETPDASDTPEPSETRSHEDGPAGQDRGPDRDRRADRDGGSRRGSGGEDGGGDSERQRTTTVATH